MAIETGYRDDDFVFLRQVLRYFKSEKNIKVGQIILKNHSYI